MLLSQHVAGAPAQPASKVARTDPVVSQSQTVQPTATAPAPASQTATYPPVAPAPTYHQPPAYPPQVLELYVLVLYVLVLQVFRLLEHEPLFSCEELFSPVTSIFVFSALIVIKSFKIKLTVKLIVIII